MNCIKLIDMETILFQIAGVIVFVLTTFLCGKLIRKRPNLAYAQIPIRVVHSCFWVLLVFPGAMGLVYPGLSKMDTLSGLIPLPGKTLTMLLGILLSLTGVYYCLASTQLLARLGRGAMAFKFSKRVVVSGVYHQVRNPMALGYYLLLLGVALAAHSTYFFLFTLFLVIPSHIFYIKYFEEFEVALRLGDPYIQYKRQTPFLIPRFFYKKNSGDPVER